MYWVYDIETFKSTFTFTIIREDRKFLRSLEISQRKNELPLLLKIMKHLETNGEVMVGYNNIGFDYPVMHEILQKSNRLPKDGKKAAEKIYDIAQKQIMSNRGERFGNTIKESDWIVPQVDLFKIWHFDNKAKATSLKALEFNMKSETIEDLPFSHTSDLEDWQIDKLIEYNQHDVIKTLDFFDLSRDQIRFREQLTEKYNRNFMNHNDTKIGKDYFIMKLEESGIKTRFKDVDGRSSPLQSKRSVIDLNKCIFPYYDFKRPEFQAVLDWFRTQKIRETKGVFTDIPEHKLGSVAQYAELTEKRKKFPGKEKPTDYQINNFKAQYPMGWIVEVPLKSKKDTFSYWMHWKVAENLNVVVNGFRFDFGTGGIHGSLQNKVVRSNKKWQLIDADVSSMYPNLAIANNAYPEHLTKKFCEIYKDVYEQRKSFAKGTAENAMLKLALNGVYGDSNNEFSPFYDPQYTMQITINGQLSLCLLAERLLMIPNCKLVQVNTDGATVAIERQYKDQYDEICKGWEVTSGLQLEYADYERMHIRDCNNYIAIYTNGKVKTKGAYVYENLEMHKNHSALVIQMAAVKAMVEGADVEQFIKQHPNKYDFMLKGKVPRSSKLILRYEDGSEKELQNTIRYYVANEGAKLIKVMPALEGKEEGGDRNIGIESDWLVKVCNSMKDYDGDINFQYYITEAQKLVIE